MSAHPVLTKPCKIAPTEPGYQRNPKGYVRCWRNGRNEYLHRWTFIQAHGPLAPGQIVMHECDTPDCYEEEHLVAGTKAENNADMAARGRTNREGLPGEAHGMAKLTEAQVLEIRRLYETTQHTYRSLGNKFGVDRTTIGLIVRRDNWRHI